MSITSSLPTGYSLYTKVPPRSAIVKGFPNGSFSDAFKISSTSLWTISSSGALILNPSRFSTTSVFLPTLVVDNLTVNVNFVWVSDEREKKNIQTLQTENDEKFSLLRPVKFQFDKSSAQATPDLESSESYGFVAQEVAALYPELIKITNQSKQTLGVNYLGFIPIMVKQIQDLQNEVKVLQERLTNNSI